MDRRNCMRFLTEITRALSAARLERATLRENGCSASLPSTRGNEKTWVAVYGRWLGRAYENIRGKTVSVRHALLCAVDSRARRHPGGTRGHLHFIRFPQCCLHVRAWAQLPRRHRGALPA